MRDVSHVHREHDPRAWHWFARGPVVAADGGRSGDEEEHRKRDVEDEVLRDVSHEPRHGEGANRVWERGDDEDEAGE
jgi:hypothetical protein